MTRLVNQKEKIKQALDELVLEIHKVQLSVKGAYTTHEGYDIAHLNLKDIELKEVMGDGYPTSTGDTFAKIVVDAADQGYKISEIYRIGRERYQKADGTVSGHAVHNPPERVKDMAEEFAKHVGVEAQHHNAENGEYAASMITKQQTYNTLEKAMESVKSNILKYIEIGRANPLPCTKFVRVRVEDTP
jgi:hypothetical protein